VAGVSPADPNKGQVIDLDEIKRRMKEGKEPTVHDLLDAIGLERREVEAVGRRLEAVETEQSKDRKHFGANVREVITEELRDFASSRSKVAWALGLAIVGLVIGLVANIPGWSAFSDANLAKMEAASAKAAVGEKADRLELVKVKDQLTTKADKAEVNQKLQDLQDEINLKADIKTVLQAMGAKADKAEVDNKLEGLTTKADKAEVRKIASALRGRAKKLEERMKVLEDKVEPPAPSPSAEPKTM
jgi:hypothetical protein